MNVRVARKVWGNPGALLAAKPRSGVERARFDHDPIVARIIAVDGGDECVWRCAHRATAELSAVEKTIGLDGRKRPYALSFWSFKQRGANYMSRFS
jgi:hypothetical protein